MTAGTCATPNGMGLQCFYTMRPAGIFLWWCMQSVQESSLGRLGGYRLTAVQLQGEGLSHHQICGGRQNTGLQGRKVGVGTQKLGPQPYPQQGCNSRQASPGVRLFAAVQRQQQNRQERCIMGFVCAAAYSQDQNSALVQKSVGAVCRQDCLW